MDISPAIQFKPTALIRVVNGAPGSLDLTATFVFNEKLWVGAFHRWQESVGIILDYNFTPQLKVGYSYDFTLTDLQDFNSGSHEISLIYDFIFSDQKIKSPRYF
jgi:type IX secretion system PorP/SprF family membrane protein